MYTAVLVVHILGALVTGVVALAAIVALIARKREWYRTAAVALAFLAAFEVMTGTALAFLSIEVSVASVCANIAVYLALVACIESVMWMRMRRNTEAFPIAQTASPVGVSLGLLLLGLVLGF